MSKAFGTKFIVVNDIRQPLNPQKFAGGPWLHIATVVRGLKEYMCFKHDIPGGATYIEEFDSSSGQFKRIDSEAEYQDLYQFLWSKGLLLEICKDKETKIAST
jgi:hypothetical protein